MKQILAITEMVISGDPIARIAKLQEIVQNVFETPLWKIEKKFPYNHGRSEGVYRYIYPKNQSTVPYKFLLAVLFTCGTLTCFDLEIGMTS